MADLGLSVLNIALCTVESRCLAVHSSYKAAGLAYHAIPLAVREAPYANPELAQRCEAFIVRDGGARPQILGHLDTMDTLAGAARSALRAGDKNEAYDLLVASQDVLTALETEIRQLAEDTGGLAWIHRTAEQLGAIFFDAGLPHDDALFPVQAAMFEQWAMQLHDVKGALQVGSITENDVVDFVLANEDALLPNDGADESNEDADEEHAAVPEEHAAVPDEHAEAEVPNRAMTGIGMFGAWEFR